MQEQFQDVGLMTGDVTLNPSASCIVMTTEVGLAMHQLTYMYVQCIIQIVYLRLPLLFCADSKEHVVPWIRGNDKR